MQKRTVSPDFNDLLRDFNDRSVAYLVVGAHELAAHRHVRATEDLGVWTGPVPENPARVSAALQAFGAPLQDLTVEDPSVPGVVFQIGLPPVPIDISTATTGLELEEAWNARFDTRFSGSPVAVLSREPLIRNESPIR